MTKVQREAIQICQRAGLTSIAIAKGGKHWKIVCEQGRIVCAATPSDHRWKKNLEAFARRLANDR